MERKTVASCKDAIVALRNFIIKGQPLPARVREMLLDRFQPDDSTDPLRVRITTEVRAWIAQHIPQGFLTTSEEYAAWTRHTGLRGASERTQMWFRMTSDWWHPRRVPYRDVQTS